MSMSYEDRKAGKAAPYDHGYDDQAAWEEYLEWLEGQEIDPASPVNGG